MVVGTLAPGVPQSSGSASSRHPVIKLPPPHSIIHTPADPAIAAPGYTDRVSIRHSSQTRPEGSSSAAHLL